MLVGPERPEAVLLNRTLYLPTFSHFLIVNNFSLSLFLFLCLSVCLLLSISFTMDFKFFDAARILHLIGIFIKLQHEFELHRTSALCDSKNQKSQGVNGLAATD